MSVINFSIKGVLEQRVNRTLKERGFSSRAEYVRSRLIKDLDEWEAAMRNVPTYYLKGKAADKLDREYDAAMAECSAGKTIKINSLADLMK